LIVVVVVVVVVVVGASVRPAKKEDKNIKKSRRMRPARGRGGGVENHSASITAGKKKQRWLGFQVMAYILANGEERVRRPIVTLFGSVRPVASCSTFSGLSQRRHPQHRLQPT